MLSNGFKTLLVQPGLPCWRCILVQGKALAGRAGRAGGRAGARARRQGGEWGWGGGGRGASGTGGPLVSGPSRGKQNDYCQHFVDTGARPQNFLRDVHLVRSSLAPKMGHDQTQCMHEGT